MLPTRSEVSRTRHVSYKQEYMQYSMDDVKRERSKSQVYPSDVRHSRLIVNTIDLLLNLFLFNICRFS
jgi:hypothetical protein